MAGAQNEFNVRVPKRDERLRYSVLKFNGMDKVDTSKWATESQLTLEREDNKGVVLASQTVQDYGEGSEYGKAAREEARRKKFGRQAKHYLIDNQPWNLSFREQDGRHRKMRGIREGGAVEHADYWIFLKSSNNEFQAYKVDDWHKFLPAITHKTLDCDQAEEKYSQRNKVMNQFALKAAIQKQLNDGEDGEAVEKLNRSLKIKDEASSDEDDEEEEKNEEETEKKNKKKKNKKVVNEKPKKDKRQRVENADDVARYESSDGEDEGREYDYMSDSGSDSDREVVPSDEKVEKELTGVDDEAGMRKMLESDESDSDEEDLTKKLLKTDRSQKKDTMDVEERDSSGSDTDDPDSNVNSVVFLPKKEEKEETANGGGAKKRPAEDMPSISGASDAKKVKVEEKPKFVEGLNEETVRKYLRRKPHTTKELLHKMKAKCGDMTKAEIVTRLAAILKAIDPHQFKQQLGKREVLFFSLTNTVA
ncbi:unnamed protein product [Caenorhabditis auriculariae]|uniref:Transcription initiation factor IIF subunit alpha n=1 Tax=Caenorhabditis auriculariae TaxID=2777116 RepID=A0A8S1H1R8_9PELO|nr:unnamed protein product [Caenorhabditis auriculariae]